MQHPFYQYVSKDKRPVAIEMKITAMNMNQGLTRAYCHVEERMKPISCFDFFQSNCRGFVPHAVCRDCIDHGYNLGSIYNKAGRLKQEMKLIQKGIILVLL